MLTTGRVAFTDKGTLDLIDLRPASRGASVIGLSHLLRAIGARLENGNSWPLPCLDLDELHKRNSERVRSRSRKKGK